MANLEDSHNIYVHCAGGYRSVIACSLLKRQGIHNLYNVIGGWSKIEEIPEKFEIEKTAAILN
jgi:rhodanese-related sulfurtransferase